MTIKKVNINIIKRFSKFQVFLIVLKRFKNHLILLKKDLQFVKWSFFKII